MIDSCFNLSFWIRNMFNVMGSRTYCICETPMDCLGDHTRVCSRAAVKSKASNPAHTTLSRSLRQYLDHGRSNGNYIITSGEPHIGDYLVRHPRGNVDRHPPLLDTQRRADIAMVNLHDNITTLVDVTIASHNAQTAAADYTVGQAAVARTIDKRRTYDRDFETTNPNVNLVIFGAVHRKPISSFVAMPDMLPPTILAESWDIRWPFSLYPFKLLVPSPSQQLGTSS
jgi:hypothetical protein